jgi:hypothetical protein
MARMSSSKIVRYADDLPPMRCSLTEELAIAGFNPDPLTLKLVTARTLSRGEEEMAGIPEITNNAASRRQLAGNLGFGSCLTDFLTAGTPALRSQRRSISSLGGIAFGIIGVFDSLLDSGILDSGIEVLPIALNGEAHSADVKCITEREAVNWLIAEYLQRLRALPRTQPGVFGLIETAIKRMYHAELQSARTPAADSRTVWWRKSVLPIAVMGTPAWLDAAAATPKGFREHLYWLCRVGEFLGWVDDFADFEYDRTSGHMNRVLAMRNACGNGIHDRRSEISFRQTLAKKVARLGGRVLSAWDRQNRVSPARNTFVVATCEWLGPSAEF